MEIQVNEKVERLLKEELVHFKAKDYNDLIHKMILEVRHSKGFNGWRVK